MRRAFSSRFVYLFLMFWLAGSVLLLLVATTSLLRNPELPILIGLVHAQGATGLFVVLLPAACGLAALVGTIQRRASAPVLLLIYSLFWLVVLVGGLLSTALHGGLPMTERTPFSQWAVDGTTFATMLACFALLAVWSIRQLAGRHGDPSVS